MSGQDEPPKGLPEEFAPTGPKLSRFPIRPAPPVQPRLFADEARFAFRLALLAGGTELAAWAWLVRSPRLALPIAALRLLRPLWAKAGTRAPRPLVAFALLFVALAAQGAAVFSIGALSFWAALAAGLPALGDLAASCLADSITVERRAAAYSWLEMGQGLGVALGVALGLAAPQLVPVGAAAALFAAGLGVPDLHDRGTPRSSWPAAVYLEVLRTPIAAQLVLYALLAGGLAAGGLRWGFLLSTRGSGWTALLPLGGMAVAARLEARAPNAVVLPRALVAVAALSLGIAPLGPLALGAAATLLPASVARGAGEMERPVASSLAWMAVALGAGLVL